MKPSNVFDLCIGSDYSIRQAIVRIDLNRRGIVLVVDEGRRLIGTVTDGDVRRAMLDNVSLDAPVADLLTRKKGAYRQPATAPVGTPYAELRRLMQEHSVRQIPLLD